MQTLDSSDSGNENGMLEPQFYAAIGAVAKVEAHLKAIAEFGIRFDERWKVEAATAGVVADGCVRFEVGGWQEHGGNMSLDIWCHSQCEAVCRGHHAFAVRLGQEDMGPSGLRRDSNYTWRQVS